MWLDENRAFAQDGQFAARGGTDQVSGSECITRIFDLIAAATSVVLLGPLFLVIAVAIKLGSGGPIFIREPIFGYGNRKIRLFKFRLMSARGGREPTCIDQFLRETGIEELPQLFNVLRGELSIIGPPPSHRFNPVLNRVKPGMIQWELIFAPRQRSDPPRL
jgi:lipopolysaccharide/colanic/teichoic acid biosynthesis glycosyltransferase